MFEILEFTEARLATLTSRSETHGDDKKPAVSIGLEVQTSNSMLDLIDKSLRPTLYTKPEWQESLPEVEEVLQVLRCNSIDRVVLPTKHEGWTLQVDDGIDDTKPKTFGGCKVDKFSVEPLQGGTVVLRFRIGTSDLDAERSGMLGMHIGQPIWITLHAPKPGEERESEETPPESDETDLFGGEINAAETETNEAEVELTTPQIATAAQKQPASRRGKGKGPWPFGDQGDDNKPATDATDAFVATHTH